MGNAGAQVPAEQTRARAGRRAQRGPTIGRVWVPKQDRRTPLIMVEVEHFGMRLTFAVAVLRRGRIELRPPLSPDRMNDGLSMPRGMQDRLAQAVFAAVKAAPEARAALRRSQRLGEEPSGTP